LDEINLSDTKLAAKVILEATQEKYQYLGMKEEAKSELFWLRTENIILKAFLVYMAVNSK
jgi:hypothetical protein